MEHYHGLSSWKAYDSSVTGVDLTKMTFEAAGKTYSIPFEPPLSSYRETRERVVEMDKQCLEALNKSDITIKEFVPPTTSAFNAVEFLVVAATFVAYSQRWWFARGGIVERVLGTSFARFCWIIQPWLITFMLALHGAEAIHFARSRLRRHSVNPRTLLYWKWVMTTFIEGIFAFRRFDRHVLVKRQEKEKQKH